MEETKFSVDGYHADGKYLNVLIFVCPEFHGVDMSGAV